MWSTIVFADAAKINNKWFQCKADNECVEVSFLCTGGVVNKSYAKEANKYYSDLNAVMNCIRNPVTEEQKKIPYRVFCKNKKCQSEGINPRAPGFS